MHYAFQDRDNLYLVLDLLTGGDLRYHIARRRRFTEEQTSNQIDFYSFRIHVSMPRPCS